MLGGPLARLLGKQYHADAPTCDVTLRLAFDHRGSLQELRGLGEGARVWCVGCMGAGKLKPACIKGAHVP